MQDIKQLRRWLAFAVTPRSDGTAEKRPVSLVTGGLASCADPQTWCSWELAKRVCSERSDYVLGFALAKEVGLCVVDFDKVRKTVNDPWPEWVLEEVERLNSFTEVSISGLGLHVLAWGSIPTNMNRQKLHVEVWDSDKLFAFTGKIFQGRDRIYARDMMPLHKRIAAGQIGPNYKPAFILYAYDTPKYRDIVEDNWAAYFTSRSDAVQSALWTLARKHELDPEKVRTEFESTKLCSAWAEKWLRLGDREIEHAIAEVKKRMADGTLKAAAGVQSLEFRKPAAAGKRADFVLKPTDKYNGWLPRSGVSLVAGSSGAGKTTLMLDLLDKCSRGESYLGHSGAGYPFLILFFDRGRFQNEETLERMGLLDKSLAIEYLPDSWDFGAASNILNAIEQWGVPPVVFVEGADLLVSDANKVQSVSPFLGWMKAIAEQYHIAIVLSCGAPKSKPSEQHVLTRDRVFGSQVWTRRAATVLYLMHVGDGSDGKRELRIEHRNAPTEKFNLQFVNGLLREYEADVEDVDELAQWARGAKWFTVAEAEGAMEVRGSLLTSAGVGKRIKELRQQKRLEQGERDGKVAFRWLQNARRG